MANVSASGLRVEGVLPAEISPGGYVANVQPTHHSEDFLHEENHVCGRIFGPSRPRILQELTHFDRTNYDSFLWVGAFFVVVCVIFISLYNLLYKLTCL